MLLLRMHVEKKSQIGESVSTPIGKPMQATRESPGFDRLLDKILSPSRAIFSSQNATPIPPTLIPVLNIEPQQQRQQHQRQNQCYNRNITDEETLDFSISQSTSALLSSNNTRENNDNSHGHDNIMTEEEQGTIYNDISAVVKNEEDDDDDDVFDLLRSVDDWPALKNFVRKKPIISETKDDSNAIECVIKDHDTVQIYGEEGHSSCPAAVVPLERKIKVTPSLLQNLDSNTNNNNSNCDTNTEQQEERKVGNTYNSVIADLNNRSKSNPNKLEYSNSPTFKSPPTKSSATKSPGTKSPSWFNNEKSRSDCPQPLNNHCDLRKSLALAIPKKKASIPERGSETKSFLPDSS
mmetsp:Transcript_23430/g.22563  ORF Transcript_23430/g.22563 Transcript_23430/m.22563 type:complete len:351 (-) Transcript_23430:117-1169(-)